MLGLLLIIAVVIVIVISIKRLRESNNESTTEKNYITDDKSVTENISLKKNACPSCGASISAGHNFCPNCGFKYSKPAITKARDHDVKRLSLTCQKCGGTMLVEPGKTILSCPYCGSSELILESDEVTIQRMKTKAYRDVEIAKQETEKIKSINNKEIEVTKHSNMKELQLEKAKLDAEIKLREQKSKDKENTITFVTTILLILLLFFLYYIMAFT